MSKGQTVPLKSTPGIWGDIDIPIDQAETTKECAMKPSECLMSLLVLAIVVPVIGIGVVSLWRIFLYVVGYPI